MRNGAASNARLQLPCRWASGANAEDRLNSRHRAPDAFIDGRSCLLPSGPSEPGRRGVTAGLLRHQASAIPARLRRSTDILMSASERCPPRSRHARRFLRYPRSRFRSEASQSAIARPRFCLMAIIPMSNIAPSAHAYSRRRLLPATAIIIRRLLYSFRSSAMPL